MLEIQNNQINITFQSLSAGDLFTILPNEVCLKTHPIHHPSGVDLNAINISKLEIISIHPDEVVLPISRAKLIIY